jgi:predicted secreted protein
MNKILIVSHCILNTASKVVSYNQEEMKQESTNREELIKYVQKNNIQLFQLPCPEFILYGAKRWGHVKDQFDHPYFRKQCREMLEPVIMQLKEYASYPERFQIVGIIAIDGSPSCGYHLTCKGDWGGEFTGCPDLHKKFESPNMAKEPGIFMEEMIAFLKKEDLDIPIMDLSAFIAQIDL